MIISAIKGGLGNQLFQYAAGRALAIRNQTELKLDISALAGNNLRSFCLQKFNTVYEIATGEEIGVIRPSGSIGRIQQRLQPYPKKAFYKQPDFGFDPRFSELRPPVYLQGYFQSEKFFSSYTTTLRQEMQLNSPGGRLEQLGDELRLQESVAVHIRRGDYTNPTELKVHGVLPIGYYQSAIEEMVRRLRHPVFFLFTDNPKAFEDFPLGINTTKVSGSLTNDALEDFYLMSQCRHNIIANSSFSWWAAWLNSNSEKVVISPKNWFADNSIGTKDLIPDNWIML